MAFKLGDRVAWVSMANGSTVEKHDEVVEVVPPGKLPDRDRFASLYRSAGVGGWRRHESYVVAVSGSVRIVGQRKVVKHRTPKPYWPLVNKLEQD